MTEDERCLLILEYKNKKQLVTKEIDKLSKIRDLLNNNCKHEQEFIDNYFWVHDNGCGLQKEMLGSYCMICGLIDYWNNKEEFKGA